MVNSMFGNRSGSFDDNNMMLNAINPANMPSLGHTTSYQGNMEMEARAAN